ncbi:MAG: DNA cytosine methyltransferase [Pseudomonadota bacterium]
MAPAGKPVTDRRFTFLEFFAGGGMARLGLGPAWRCQFANDVDARKCNAYRLNFGAGDLVEAPIETLKIGDLPDQRADLAWASFPCQDLSLAGARSGMGARRSGLFFDFWRLIEALTTQARAPRLIAIENVAGLLTSNGGADFETILKLMIDAGYRVGARVIDAAAFTPQSRPRLFIVGVSADTDERALNGVRDRRLARFADAAGASWIDLPAPAARRNIDLAQIVDWDKADWDGAAQTKRLVAMMSSVQRNRLDDLLAAGGRRAGAGFRRTRYQDGRSVQRFEARFDGVAGCLRTPAGGSSRQILIACENGKIRTRLFTPREAARLMGLPDDYLLPANETAALKLCGDGVCVPVVSWLAEAVFAPVLAGAKKAAA